MKKQTISSLAVCLILSITQPCICGFWDSAKTYMTRLNSSFSNLRSQSSYWNPHIREITPAEIEQAHLEGGPYEAHRLAKKGIYYITKPTYYQQFRRAYLHDLEHSTLEEIQQKL